MLRSPPQIVFAIAVYAMLPWGHASAAWGLAPDRTEVKVGGRSTIGKFALSPNGSQIVIVAPGEDGRAALWTATVTGEEVKQLPGTEDARGPFWSADGNSIAFFARNKLRVASLRTGGVEELCDAALNATRGDWSAKGVLLFVPGGFQPVYRVVPGGFPEPVYPLSKERNEFAQFWPHFLPDGVHFIYLSLRRGRERRQQRVLMLGSLSGRPPRTLIMDASEGLFVRGNIVFSRAGKLVAQRFDMKKLALDGTPFQISDDRLVIDKLWGSMEVSASRAGDLMYQTGGPLASKLVWYDRNAVALEQPLPPGIYGDFALSADGKQLAVVKEDVASGTTELWSFSSDGRQGTRMAGPVELCESPVWSPNGKQLAYMADSDGMMDIYQLNSGSPGTEVRLVKRKTYSAPREWSKDGKFLYFGVLDPRRESDLWALRVTDGRQFPLLQTPYREFGASISPDGQWLAYVSDLTGKFAVYIRRVSVTQGIPHLDEGPLRVAESGGRSPRWSADGKELFIITLDGELSSISVNMAPGLKLGPPRRLFLAPATSYAVSPDGQRFLFRVRAEEKQFPVVRLRDWEAAPDDRTR